MTAVLEVASAWKARGALFLATGVAMVVIAVVQRVAH